MKTRITLRLLSLAALGSLIVAGANCADQREPECTTPAAGHFPTRLVAVDVPAGCEGAVQTAMVVATRSYYKLDADGNVDYDQPFNVAIQTYEMGQTFIDIEGEGDRITGGVPPESLIASNKLYAYGAFTAPNPDGNDQCYIPTLAPAVLDFPGLDEVIVEDDPETEDEDESDVLFADPAYTYQAEWSNLTFLVSTAYPGVQFTGTLKYTTPVFEDIIDPSDPDMERTIGRRVVNTCTITYTATGVSAVNTYDCSTPDQDDPETPDVNENPPYYREVGYNQALCGAEADFDQGIPFGAGINPDFPIVCDPETKLCLLDGPFRTGVKN